LRTRAALEHAARDQKAIGAISLDHGNPGAQKQWSDGRAATL
jgi:hypothetical protein